MENNTEHYPESWAEKQIREMAERGFEHAGGESLGRNAFDSRTARFLPLVEQTVDQIKERYSAQGHYEVQLVQIPDQKIEDIIRRQLITVEEASTLEIPEAERQYLVFRKPL